MNNLVLAKSESFGSVNCDFYNDGNEILMTRRQIGEALEYNNPNDAINDIHSRHKKRLDKFSTTRRLRVLEGNREVTREVVLYSAKGVYEICRWSQQRKADAFFDWVYEILESIRKGELIVAKPAEISNPNKKIAPAVQDAYLTSRALMKMFGVKRGLAQTIAIDMIENSTGLELDSLRKLLPQEEREAEYMTATALGVRLNVSPVRVNRILNKLGFLRKGEERYGWMLTEEGKEYGKEFSCTGCGYQIRWKESVVGLVAEHC